MADVVVVAMESSDQVLWGHFVDCFFVGGVSFVTFFAAAPDFFSCMHARQFPTRMLQLQMFARDASTGELSAGVSANVGTYTSAVQGSIADFVLSEINNHVVLAMSNSDSGATGGVVVLDITVGTMMNSAPIGRRCLVFGDGGVEASLIDAPLHERAILLVWPKLGELRHVNLLKCLDSCLPMALKTHPTKPHRECIPRLAGF